MSQVVAPHALPSFAYPRYFRFGRFQINSYKFFLCIGIYCGILVSAAVGDATGIPPLPLGLGMLFFGIVGLLGARLYHLVVHFPTYRRNGLRITSRDQSEGGWGVLGGLVIVPVSLLFDAILGIPIAEFWDHMAIAIAVGGAWIRFGCVCNGCCVGRDAKGWFGLRQHDVHGEYRRRVPVQLLEIAWWMTSWALLALLWPLDLPDGSYAFIVLGWYGIGRFWLEPLRKKSARIRGVRVDRIVAAVLALT
ncbi:MAG TPA: prolipoprotein diacylglyceryl transferase family protein, partial [Rhodothermales bacterium]